MSLPGTVGLLGGKAAPTIKGAPVASAGYGSTVNVPMPSGIVAGETLLLFIIIKGGSYNTAPSGWTLAINTPVSGSAGTPAFHLFKKTAVGNEGTATFTLSAGRAWAAVVVRVGDAMQVEGAAAYLTGGGNAAANPPSVTPSWGDEEALWFAAATTGGSGATAMPAGYAFLAGDDDNTNGAVSIDVAYRTAAVASEDPAAFVIASTNWCAATVGVH